MLSVTRVGGAPRKLFFSALLCALAVIGTTTAYGQGVIISNGTIQLGVNPEGHLNTLFPGDDPVGADPLGIGYMGLRYIPTGAASTEPGCQCEGWGVAIVSTGVSGYANVDSDGGAYNLALVSFSSTASTATSVVDVLDGSGNAVLRVTHSYFPIAGTPNLYEVAVDIMNTSGVDLVAGDLIYRRVMDWDIYPTPFDEYVTIQGVPALLGVANGNNVHQTDNNGFNSANPLDPFFSSYGEHNTNFIDSGPADHGALFDFEFEALVNGATRSFATYYGAAATEAEADLVRSLVDGDPSDVEIGLYSYGQACGLEYYCGPDNGPDHGAPNTFIFGFGAEGGILPPPPPPPTDSVPEPASLMLVGFGLAGLAVIRRRNR